MQIDVENDDDDDDDGGGDVEVQVAVKTVLPTVAAKGVREFTEEASLQLELEHANIAKMLGVCMTQKPFLARNM